MAAQPNEPYLYTAYDDDSVDIDVDSPFFLDHVSRYWWAASFAMGKRVLDCATGKGYGAYILSRSAAAVLGVDLNSQSLRVARQKFSAANLVFQEWDVLRLPDLPATFDLVTAFEIIEHVPPFMSDLLLAGIAQVLVPGGLALISTPNHDVVKKSGVGVPKFHINNLVPGQFARSLRRHFSHARLLGQFVDGRFARAWYSRSTSSIFGMSSDESCGTSFATTLRRYRRSSFL